MPKKVHGRSAPKSKPRTRSATPRPRAIPGQPDATQDELIPTATSQRAASTSQTMAAPSAGNSPTAARRAVSTRRTPVLAINYDYLRRDIRLLSMLAPSMVVLLVIAFFVLR